MAVDRFGRPLRLFWQPHEIEWVIAASTLPRNERLRAYRDISDMSGRSIKAIQCRASALKVLERQKARAWLQTYLRKNWASGGFPAAPRRVWVETPTMSSNAKLAPSKDGLESEHV